MNDPLALAFQQARATFDGQQLVVTTGSLTRVWQWTGRGLLTRSVTRLATGHTWCNPSATHAADWQLPTCLNENPPGQIGDAALSVDDDEGFTSAHLLVTLLIDYPSHRLQAQFRVRAYPDVPGLHVQLAFRALDGFDWDPSLHRRENTDVANRMAWLDRGYRRAEFLPVALGDARRRAWGFHNDAQHRNDTYAALLKEHVTPRPLGSLETCDWANAMGVECGGEGIALLKESHRCVNQPGIDGGVFAIRPGEGLEAIGLGVCPCDLTERFVTAWAHWTVVYANADRARQTAFKQFDRARYPTSPQYAVIQANTWGSSIGYLQHREAAGQDNVLRELESCAELGIDLLQVDDGWQGNGYDRWEPCPERYPEGWAPVTRKARVLGVKLGLWCAGERVDVAYLKKTFDQAGFLWYKLDFMNCTSRAILDALLAKVRAFQLYSGRNTRVNWDTTEVNPRLGYFLGREYGAIFYANRKPVWPPNVVYRPHTVLRDLWELSTYLDLRQILGDVQDPRMTDPVLSDAHEHSAAYCTAIALMSLPTFFMETHKLDPRDRPSVTHVLRAYKQHRDAMLQGMVHPIGDRPDGSVFTGFQCHHAPTRSGYLTLFRERNCPSSTGVFELVDMPGDVRVRLTNLLTGESADERLRGGQLEQTIGQSPDFRFFRYETIG